MNPCISCFVILIRWEFSALQRASKGFKPTLILQEVCGVDVFQVLIQLCFLFFEPFLKQAWILFDYKEAEGQDIKKSNHLVKTDKIQKIQRLGYISICWIYDFEMGTV